MNSTIKGLRFGVTAAAVMFVSVIFADSYPEPVGGVVTLNVTSGSVTYTGEIPAEAVSLVKTGIGEARLQDPSPAFDGDVIVSEGTLTPLVSTACGGTSWMHRIALTVESGATLDVGAFATDGLVNYNITVGGSGAPGSKGAIVFDNATSAGNDVFFRPFVLSGDATVYVNCANRIGFCNESLNPWGGSISTFDLRQHKLTINSTSGGVVSHLVHFANGKIQLDAGQFNFESGPGLVEAEGYVSEFILAKEGAKLTFAGGTTETGKGWVIRAQENNTVVERILSKATGKFVWQGDVEVADGKKIAFSSSVDGDYVNVMNFTGRINGSFKKNGSGACIFTDCSITNRSIEANDGAQVRVIGGEHALTSIWNAYSLIDFTGGASVYCVTDPAATMMAQTYQQLELGAVVSFSNCTFAGGMVPPTASYSGFPSTCFGMSMSYADQSLVRVEDGAVVTNGLVMAFTGDASVIQRGGQATWLRGYPTWDGDDFVKIGMATSASTPADAFMQVVGGACCFPQNVRLGTGIGSGAWFVQNGGTTTADSAIFEVGLGGYGEVYLGGGTMTFNNCVRFANRGKNCTTPNSVFTVAGTNTKLRLVQGGETFRTNACNVAWNLNAGGLIETPFLRCFDSSVAENGAYVSMNFNGGGFRPLAGTAPGASVCGSCPPSAATVYDGGIVFDMGACTNADGSAVARSCPFPLAKATGKGVAAIALPTDAGFAAEKYLGPARIYISGNGRDASAVVDWDADAMIPRAIIVTCPGCGYDAATVVQIESADHSKRYDCAFELKDNAGTGGIVIRGNGRLDLPAANWLDGDVLVEGGELAVDGSVAVPNRIKMTCNALFKGGKITSNGSLDLSATKVEIVDPENLPKYADAGSSVCFAAMNLVGMPQFAEDYGNVSLRRKGNSICCGVPKGLVLLFR